jgi:hypothetical protein
MGRPTTFSQDIADKLCSKLAIGKSLRTTCSSDDMPCVATVFNWFRTQPDFLEQYTRAKEEAADALTDEMLDISDAESAGLDATSVSHARLKIETRKWLASKLKPKKYGDKITQEHTGKDGGAIQYDNLTDEQLSAKLTKLLHDTNTPTND